MISSPAVETTPPSPTHEDATSDYASMGTPSHSRHSSLMLSQDSLFTVLGERRDMLSQDSLFTVPGERRDTPVMMEEEEWEGLQMKVQRPMRWHFRRRYSHHEIMATLSGHWK